VKNASQRIDVRHEFSRRRNVIPELVSPARKSSNGVLSPRVDFLQKAIVAFGDGFFPLDIRAFPGRTHLFQLRSNAEAVLFGIRRNRVSLADFAQVKKQPPDGFAKTLW
jgi:hypothetical protein